MKFFKQYFIKHIDKLKLLIFDLALGKPKDKKLKKNYKKKIQTSINFNFEFDSNQKRKYEEYEDVRMYFTQKHNYVVSNKENNKENFVEEVNFGMIDSDKLNIDQKTSCNVWLAILDENLALITSKKINLAYFEKPSHSVTKKLKKFINTFFKVVFGFERKICFKRQYAQI